MKILYRLYQLFIFVPIFLVLTILTSVCAVIGSLIGNSHFWSYYPGHCWAWLTVRLLLLPVKVEGREHLDPKQSYIFVANHQGVFDIFLVYGYLNRNFKWMMKKALEKIPFVGYACKRCHFIMVDRHGASKIRATYDQARAVLREGMSLTVFPEGARTFTGHMGFFRRGAFMLADELQLPVCPLTINGSFNIMPRMRDWHWVEWHPMTLTIHEPIFPPEKGREAEKAVMQQSWDAINGSLVEEYRGYVENKDQ